VQIYSLNSSVLHFGFDASLTADK